MTKIHFTTFFHDQEDNCLHRGDHFTMSQRIKIQRAIKINHHTFFQLGTKKS